MMTNATNKVDGAPVGWRQRAVISVPEAGAVLGLGRSASYAAARRGDIPTLTIGRLKLVPVARLRALLDPSDREVTS
jgi:hypothetical protein